jgi:hypothetical protein
MRALTLGLLISIPAVAQVFTWEDKDGLHYSNKRSAVPKGAKVMKVDQEAHVKPSRGLELSSTPASVEKQFAPRENPYVEREWRDRFIQAHRAVVSRKQELSALEASLPNKVDCVPQPRGGFLSGPAGQQNPPEVRCVPNEIHDRVRVHIALKRAEVRDAETDLEQLERQATLEAIPREWRRGW